MTRFLNLTALDEVLALVRREFPAPEQSELVPLLQATGRVTSAPLFAAFTVPEVPLASMDGFAVRSSETRGARETAPLRLPGAVRVNTGNPLPPGMDAVVMIEEVDSMAWSVSYENQPGRTRMSVSLARRPTKVTWSSLLATGSARSILVPWPRTGSTRSLCGLSRWG